MSLATLLKKDEVQTARQYNLDLLKALAIIAMILCHSIIQLGMHHTGYQQDLAYLIGDYFFGDYLAVAHAFMFAMGVGIVYSQRISPPISSEEASNSIFLPSSSTSSATGFMR